jgi:hypothetical protein
MGIRDSDEDARADAPKATAAIQATETAATDVARNRPTEPRAQAKPSAIPKSATASKRAAGSGHGALEDDLHRARDWSAAGRIVRTCEHLGRHDGQRKLIAARCDRFSTRLLRGPVGGGPDDTCQATPTRLEVERKPKVHHDRSPGRLDHDVGGLQVPMHDPRTMRSINAGA